MPLVARRGVGVAIAFAVSLAIASAPAVADTSSCSAPTLTQPFSAWGDDNWYTLVPGQSPGNFDGTGWTLHNGAKLGTATLPGGESATVLHLPRGSSAVSPEMCVDATNQAARMMIRGVFGRSRVVAHVSYEKPRGWSQPAQMGEVNGTRTWQPSATLSLNPPALGWQIARFTLSAAGFHSGSLIYNFYIDPYGRG